MAPSDGDDIYGTSTAAASKPQINFNRAESSTFISQTGEGSGINSSMKKTSSKVEQPFMLN